MDPATLIPATDALPVAAKWFEVLLLAVFPIHLLFMNVALGGAAICLANMVRRDPVPGLTKQLYFQLPIALALAVNFGVAALLFLQVLYGNFVYTSSVITAGFWLLFIPILLAAYLCLYVGKFRFDSSKGLRLPMMAVTLTGLVVCSFILSNTFSFMLTPERWTAWFANSGGFHLNTEDPTFFPRWLHYVTGSLAVAGIFVALWARAFPGQDPEGARARERLGMKWFFRATVVQMVLGVLWLVTLPKAVLLGFMGGDGVATTLLVSSIALGLAALESSFRGRVLPAAVLAAATVFAMSWVRDQLRKLYLDPYQTLDQLPLDPDHVSPILFALALALAVPACWWMIRVWRRAVEPAAREG